MLTALGNNQLAAETITPAAHSALITAREKAAYNELKARVGYFLAVAELERAVGMVPGE